MSGVVVFVGTSEEAFLPLHFLVWDELDINPTRQEINAILTPFVTSTLNQQTVDMILAPVMRLIKEGTYAGLVIAFPHRSADDLATPNMSIYVWAKETFSRYGPVMFYNEYLPNIIVPLM